MVLFVEKFSVYMDFLIAEITFLGKILTFVHFCYFFLKKVANKQYIFENKYKKLKISTTMVLFVDKSSIYIDFLTAEIIFLGKILR